MQPWLWDLFSAPYQPHRKVYFGAIYAVLQLQKKCGYAGPFRIRGYLEKDFGLKLSEATIKKIMALNRRVHLAPQRPVLMEVREARQGPAKSTAPFQHTFIDLRYLDAKPEGVQLYSCLLLEGHSRTIPPRKRVFVRSANARRPRKSPLVTVALALISSPTSSPAAFSSTTSTSCPAYVRK